MKRKHIIMKNNKSFLYAILSMLAISSLVACGGKSNTSNNNAPYDDEEEERELEIGDTVKEWKSSKNSATLPLDVAEGGTGTREIAQDFGNEDQESLHYSVESNSGYLTTEMSNPYFQEFDAKNGDIISLFVYIPSNSNLVSLELELNSISYGGGWGGGGNSDTIKGTKIVVSSEKENKWIRLEGSYDSLYNLGSIRVNFVPVSSDNEVEFYVDDINITLGEETVKTEYEYKEESLYKTYEDYFIVGTELSGSMVRNNEFQKITKHNFNSVTAENEAKPDQVLDQTACQELAKTDETAVAIKTTSFERIYNWCEANHIKVRHHTFVWHDQTPSWFFNSGYQSNGQQVSREIMLGRLNNFFKVMIETLDERWPGLVYALDVVNEAIPEENEVRKSNWYNTIGEDYIYQAFVAASRHKTDYMDLYYNDYSFEQSKWGGPKRCQAAVDNEKLLKKAIDENLIDGIGIQSHCLDYEDVDAILEDAKIVFKAGIKCQLTELDINCSGSSEFETKQKDAYSKLIKGLIKGMDEGTMNVNAVVLWGITDDLSWHSTNYPLLFNSDYSKKPAYYSFLEAIDEADV